MIKINFYNDGFIVEGHANYANLGEDIVCSAISAITLGSLDWFEKQSIVCVQIDEKKPIIKIQLKMNQKNEIGLSLIKHQIQKIYQSYPKYIKFNQSNNKM